MTTIEMPLEFFYFVAAGIFFGVLAFFIMYKIYYRHDSRSSVALLKYQITILDKQVTKLEGQVADYKRVNDKNNDPGAVEDTQKRETGQGGCVGSYAIWENEISDVSAALHFDSGITTHKAVNYSIEIPPKPVEKAEQVITLAGEVQVRETAQNYIEMVGKVTYDAEMDVWAVVCGIKEEGEVYTKRLALGSDTKSVDFTSSIVTVSEKQSSTLERLRCAATTQPKKTQIELKSKETATLGIFEIEDVTIFNVNDGVQTCSQLPDADELKVSKITPHAAPENWHVTINKRDCGRSIVVTEAEAEAEKSNTVTIQQNPMSNVRSESLAVEYTRENDR